MMGQLSTSVLGFYLHKLIALFAGGDEVVTELILRLPALDNGELI